MGALSEHEAPALDGLGIRAQHRRRALGGEREAGPVLDVDLRVEDLVRPEAGERGRQEDDGVAAPVHRPVEAPGGNRRDPPVSPDAQRRPMRRRAHDAKSRRSSVSWRIAAMSRSGENDAHPSAEPAGSRLVARRSARCASAGPTTWSLTAAATMPARTENAYASGRVVSPGAEGRGDGTERAGPRSGLVERRRDPVDGVPLLALERRRARRADQSSVRVRGWPRGPRPRPASRYLRARAPGARRGRGGRLRCARR